MDTNFWAEYAKRTGAVSQAQHQIASMHSLVNLLVVVVAVLIVAKIVFVVISMLVACRGGGLRAIFSYLFNPVEFRERQREKIRAGFRRNRQHSRSHREGGGDSEPAPQAVSAAGSLLSPLRSRPASRLVYPPSSRRR
ncbi:MAG: hypothetical protein JW850_07825 [Thermoflexales bacterium]|nr:hypothetical protein [Thermoflexales bacterium]